MIAIDVQKVFDCVNHDILYKTLDIMGIYKALGLNRINQTKVKLYLSMVPTQK